MGPLLRGVFLLVTLCTFSAAGLDFHPGSEPLGRSVFVRRSSTGGRAAQIAKRSVSAAFMAAAAAAASPNHRIKRGSVEQEESCKQHEGFKSKLDANTHSVSYLLLHIHYTQGGAGV